MPTHENDFILYSDHVYGLHLQSDTGYTPVAHITQPRVAWHENIDCRIRRALRTMICSQVMFIEGVWVKRTGAPRRQRYIVAKEHVVNFDGADDC